MTYEPFAGLLKPYWDLPLSGVPAALSTRTIAEGVYDLWDGWDALEPEGRQSVAEGHDAMFDPARKGERESFCKLIQEIDQCLASIALWEKMHPQTITEIGVQETKLATLTAELATLQQRLVAPSFSALPAPVTEPDQSTYLTATVPPASDDPRTRRAKKPTIEAVALDYMRKVYRAGQFQSAAKFHKHLIKTAGVNGSPFEMGTGLNDRKLFCPAASSFFDSGTLGKMWAKIRAG